MYMYMYVYICMYLYMYMCIYMGRCGFRLPVFFTRELGRIGLENLRIEKVDQPKFTSSASSSSLATSSASHSVASQ